MVVSNISTHQIFRQTLDDVTKVSSELAQQQGQLSSGSKSRDFAGIAPQLQQFLSLSASIEKSEQFINDNELVLSRIETTSNVIGDFIDTATELNSLISQRRSGVQVTGAFQLQLEEKWQLMAAQLNTNSGGRFLFSGTKLDSAAVDTVNFPKLATEGVPDDGYYLGSNEDVTLRASDTVNITYNVRANDPAFQKVFAGIATAFEGHINNDDAKLQEAFNFIRKGCCRK